MKTVFYFIFLPVKDNPKMKLYFSLFWLMFCNDNTRYLQNSKERKCLAQCWIGEVEWGLPMHGNKEVIIRRREKKKKKAFIRPQIIWVAWANCQIELTRDDSICETACTLVCGDSGICLHNANVGLGRERGCPRTEKHYCLVWFIIFLFWSSFLRD